MFFRKRSNSTTVHSEPDTKARLTIQHSSAETAHLVGPGYVKLQAAIPIWKPVDGRTLSLHPRYLKRLLCYGNVDLSTACLQLFWKRGIVISFLSQDSASCLGMLRPVGSRPNLPRLQHLSAEDPRFVLSLAQEIVSGKLDAAADSIRYYQQQGRGAAAGQALQSLLQLKGHVGRTHQLSSLRGVEGQGALIWFRFFASLLPAGWRFEKRSARPPADPVNALLSLGYSLATTRCGALLAAHDLDPDVGFLHEIRPGRPSLACDLVESLRVPLVDRMVLNLLSRKQIRPDSFDKEGQGCRLLPADFKNFLGHFESEFNSQRKPASFQQQTCTRIQQWIARIGSRKAK